MVKNISDEIIKMKTAADGAALVAAEPTEPRYTTVGGQMYTIERADELDVRRYIAKVMRHKALVIIVTVVLTAISAVVILSRPSVYQAVTRIQVDYENNGMLAGAPSEPTTFVDRAYFNTQLELLTSPTLIKRAVMRLQDKEATEMASAKPYAMAIPYLQNSIRTVYAAASSDPSAPADAADGDLDAHVAAIEKSLSVQPVVKARQAVKDTRLIDIAYSHPDPKVCTLVANALADELVEMNLDKKLATNSTENKYLRKNIQELTEKIRNEEEQLLAYGRNFQLPTLEGSQNTVVERLVGLNRQLLEAENERKQAEAAHRAVQESGAADALAEEGAKQIAEIDNKLDELRQRRQMLLVEVTEKYPEVKEIDSQIALLQQQARDRRSRATTLLKTNTETRYRQAVAKENAIRSAFDQQRSATMNQNDAAINYKLIQQSIETNKKLLDGMTQRSTENEMLRAKVPNNISVVDYAEVPSEPVDKNNLQYLALAFMFSLSAGVGLAFLRDHFGGGVHSVDEVEKAISSPALAIVPGTGSKFLAATRDWIAPNQLHLSDGVNEQRPVGGGPELILNSDGLSPICEAFRRLRTTLLLSPTLGGLKRILVTSSRKGEGKTTTSINLATSLAQAGARVLLIDADLRNPRLGKIFNIDSSIGLSRLLTPRPAEHDPAGHTVTVTNGLDILPAGENTREAAELLGSASFSDLLDLLAPLYDHIIIDSPPVTTFADSTVVASLVDGVLMVVQAGGNSQEAAKHSARQLRMVGASIIGVVLNKAHTKPENYYGLYSN